MTEEKQPTFAIRHRANKTAFIKTVKAPPRLSEWTDNINEAWRCYSYREAQATVAFIAAVAFEVELFEIEE